MKNEISHSKEIPHTHFNAKIYEWTKTMEERKWLSLSGIKMPKEEFVQAIAYLIACGEPLKFNDEFTAIMKEGRTYFTR